MSARFAALLFFVSLLSASNGVGRDGYCERLIALISNEDVNVSVTANNQLNVDDVDRENLTLREDSVNASGSGWCFARLSKTSAYTPYLKIQFNSTYRIERIDVSGTSNDSYVTRLLMVNDTENDILFLKRKNDYRIHDTTLTADNATEIATINLEGEMVAMSDAVLVVPVTWSENPSCLRLELYGCPLDEKGGISFHYVMVVAPVAIIILFTLILIAITCGICCYRLGKRSKESEFVERKQRTFSTESDATLRVVSNALYHKHSERMPSDKRPFAQGSVSYETVSNFSRSGRISEETRPTDSDVTTDTENNRPLKVPRYEVQYEPVKCDDEKRPVLGKPMDTAAAANKESSSDTISSHHTYDVVIGDEREKVMEASTESVIEDENLDKETKRDTSDSAKEEREEEGAIALVLPPKKKTPASGYENILSFDSRQAFFFESSGPQHFAV